MNKADIKQIIFEEIEAAIKELNENMSPEDLAADSRPEEDDITPPGIEDMSPDPIFGADPSYVEEEELSEMPRTSNKFKLSQDADMKQVLQFMQRVNNRLKTFKSPGQKRPKKRFTPEEMKSLATAMLNPEGFTSKDVIASTSYNSPAQANKFLKALEMKGLITLTSQLKKAQEPARDPDAPETRGRKAKSAEFDIPDDALDMDFGDFDNLDLSDPLAETTTMTNLEKYIKQQIREAKNSLTENVSPQALIKVYQDEIKAAKENEQDDEIPAYRKGIEMLKKGGKPEEVNDKVQGLIIKLTGERGDPTVFLNKAKRLSEAKNPLAKKMKEIENQGRIAALETKLAAVAEMIEETEGRLTRIDEDNEFKEMMDKNAVKEVRKQLKELEKAKGKLEKERAKLEGKVEKKAVVDEDLPVAEDAVEEDAIDAAIDEVELEEDNFALNESTLRFQKLAGLITESDIQKKKLSLNEGLDSKDLKVLKVTIDSFLTQGDEGPVPKAGDILTYKWTDDNEEIKGEIPGKFVKFDETRAGKYEVKKVGGNKYEFKVTVKVDVDKL